MSEIDLGQQIARLFGAIPSGYHTLSFSTDATSVTLRVARQGQNVTYTFSSPVGFYGGINEIRSALRGLPQAILPEPVNVPGVTRQRGEE